MADHRLRTLGGLLELVRPAFTRPSFARFVTLLRGWVLAPHPGTVASALVSSGAAGRSHHAAFHRFFARGTWLPDEVGVLLLHWIARHCAVDGALQLAVDDTVTRKKGPKLFGLGTHLDPVRSTRGYRNFVFGHLWVVLVAVIRVPFSSRLWAVPLFFRLYRQQKDCVRTRDRYRKKTELARELIDLAAQTASTNTLHLSADSAYCCETVLRDLPRNVIVYGVLRDDAALTALPIARKRGPGRPRVRGERLPTPRQLAAEPKPWRRIQATTYGHSRPLHIKQMCAQWYQGRGSELMRIVVVRIDAGRLRQRTYFCTDPSRSAREIVERYTARWQIEVCFRDMKQQVGFGTAPARKREAVERTTPFAGYVYSLTVLWACEALPIASAAPQIARPWHRDKTGLSFADLIHVARIDLLDPAVERDLARKPRATRPLKCPLAA